ADDRVWHPRLRADGGSAWRVPHPWPAARADDVDEEPAIHLLADVDAAHRQRDRRSHPDGMEPSACEAYLRAWHVACPCDLPVCLHGCLDGIQPDGRLDHPDGIWCPRALDEAGQLATSAGDPRLRAGSHYGAQSRPVTA